MQTMERFIQRKYLM